MVSTRSRGRPPKKKREEENTVENDGENGSKAEYEESRAQRIKENAERMKSLGLFDLFKNLKPRPSSSQRKSKPTPAPSNDPPRRSSRLKDLPRVIYTEKKPPPKGSVVVENIEIHIEEGENPEIYTEEHEKLLGDSKAVWELCVDGFDEDGMRIYDPVQGKSCHQCRQKTAGLRTECSKCDTGMGQFCGDCLYMRYGENVKEVNQNPEWVCPGCRGICNCSRCRRDKGWNPTGAIYKKVAKLGFKSVAHYLIQTRGKQANELAAADNLISANGSLSVDDVKEELTDSLSMPPLVGEKSERKNDMKLDSDEEYRGDVNDEDGDDGSSENASQ